MVDTDLGVDIAQVLADANSVAKAASRSATTALRDAARSAAGSARREDVPEGADRADAAAPRAGHEETVTPADEPASAQPPVGAVDGPDPALALDLASALLADVDVPSEGSAADPTEPAEPPADPFAASAASEEEVEAFLRSADAADVPSLDEDDLTEPAAPDTTAGTSAATAATVRVNALVDRVGCWVTGLVAEDTPTGDALRIAGTTGWRAADRTLHYVNLPGKLLPSPLKNLLGWSAIVTVLTAVGAMMLFPWLRERESAEAILRRQLSEARPAVAAIARNTDAPSGPGAGARSDAGAPRD